MMRIQMCMSTPDLENSGNPAKLKNNLFQLIKAMNVVCESKSSVQITVQAGDDGYD